MLNWERVWMCFRLWHVMPVHLKPCRLIQFIRFCSSLFVQSSFRRNEVKARSILLQQFTPSSDPPQNATSQFENQQLDKVFKLYIFPWFIVNCWIVPIETVFSLSHPVIFTSALILKNGSMDKIWCWCKEFVGCPCWAFEASVHITFNVWKLFWNR